MTKKPKHPTLEMSAICPCGGSSYATCCQPLHQGAAAKTPEQLMRSRYSAFVKRLGDYLLQSWHPEHRPTTIDFEDGCVWLGLDVLATTVDADDVTGTVRFVARYRIGGGSVQRLGEHSEFVRHFGRWVYLRAMQD